MITEEEFREIVPVAKNNLIQYFDFIFIDKYLDACCGFFYEITGLNLNFKEKVNVSPVEHWVLQRELFKNIALNSFHSFFKYDLLIYEFIEGYFLDITRKIFSFENKIL